MSDKLIQAEQINPDEYYTVLHGYGRVPEDQKHWIDNTEFIGGVAREVRGEQILAWRKASLRTKVAVFTEDATEADFAAIVGVGARPERATAVIRGQTPESLIAALSDEQREALSRLLKPARKR